MTTDRNDQNQNTDQNQTERTETMFNRKTTEATEPTFTPDMTGRYVAALDCPTADRHRGRPHYLHKLVGWETAPDGSRLPVVLPFEGSPRTLRPGEPFELTNDERTFDLAAWLVQIRAQALDARDAAERTRRRGRLAAGLRSGLAVHPTPGHVNVRESERDREALADLTAEGIARPLDEHVWTLTERTEVELSRWPYLGLSGPATFTPAGAVAQVLLFNAPSRREPVAAGRYRVIGYLTPEGADVSLPVFVTYGPDARAEVATEWEEYTGAEDVAEWVDRKRADAEQVAKALAAEEARGRLLAKLKTNHVVRAYAETDTAALELLRREGYCFRVDDAYVLAPTDRNGRR